MDVVIEGRALFNGRLEQCCVGIKDGKIAAVKRSLEGEKNFRFGDNILLPGAIDPHVHFRDPGMTHKEDWTSGSIAALHGGVTCAFDMPNTSPATITLEALREKRSIASRKSYIDFGLFAGVTPGNDIIPLATEAIGFKMFMGSSTASILVSEDADLERLMPVIARTGRPLSVHAEDERLILKDPVKALADHASNRPVKAEVNAIKRLLAKAGEAKVNICHVSSPAGLEALQGSNFYKEVTTHHLFLDINSPLAKLGKVNPPLRTREERETMLKAFIQGRFDMLGSDHAPHTLDEKSQDMGAAPSGVPGVETMVPLMMNLVKKGQLDLYILARCFGQGPGDRFGLKKGRIAVGYDADIMVIDPKNVSHINADHLHSRCGWTPYEGMEALFPTDVFLRGEQLIKDGHMVGERTGRDVVGAAKFSGRSK